MKYILLKRKKIRMKNTFDDLGISSPILDALKEMGFETPTPVQSEAIPHILNHKDLIVMSKTGSGKTAVFGVTMLQMTDPDAAGPQGLILTPTRELAVQIDSDIKQMAKNLSHRTTAVYGQHNMNTEIQALEKGITIVAGTPGRVYDHIQHGTLKTKHIRFLVLDEADRMLDMGFLDQVARIIKALPKERITLLFSATIPPEIHHICERYMKNPVTIEIESPTMTVDTIQQAYYRVEHDEKRTQLNRLLLVEQPESCMIFCNTRIAVDRVQNFLTRKGYASEALHGDIPQSRRMMTIQRFKQGKFHILVATDVAARGIHIEDLSLVINYDVPVEKDSYVHRIGRTGRAGHDGRAITLVTSDDIMSLYEIEEHIGAMIALEELPSEAVFNQRMAQAKEWLEANSIKGGKPARTVSEPASGEARKNSRRRKSDPPPHGKHNETKTPVQASGRTPMQTSAKISEPASGEVLGQASAKSARQPFGKTSGQAPAKITGQASAQPSRQPSSKTGTTSGTTAARATVKRSIRINNTAADTPVTSTPAKAPIKEEAAGKKSFFQRVLHRLFGR